MLQLAKGILAAIGISLTFGAVQLALGRDLSGVSRNSISQHSSVPQNSLGVAEASAINRTAKADRAVAAAESTVQTRTISFRLNALSDTSILVRLPIAKEARNGPSVPLLRKPGDRKMAVACEPAVSVLTEVAKLLQPGRCVT
jgi:hypothetical protein